jgi:Cytochrome P460
VILANPMMIDAYRAGVPDNGKHFPDGSKIAKIHWNAKKSKEAPAPTTVPDTLHDVDFIVKDSKRFPDTNGWAYAQFNYDTASDTFTPDGSGTNCGYACHTIVAAKDYIFTAYGKRWTGNRINPTAFVTLCSSAQAFDMMAMSASFSHSNGSRPGGRDVDGVIVDAL